MVDRDDLTERRRAADRHGHDEADLILFVVDIRDELMPLDEEVAQRLRYVNTPVILVMNKADTPSSTHRGGEFYKLGRGKPIAVSTQQNRNKKALLKLIEEMLPAGDDDEAGRRGDEDRRRRPPQHRQVHVHQHPGPRRADDRLRAARAPPATRSTSGSSSTACRSWRSTPPGVRRKAKIRDNLDFYSIHRAERSIRRADVVLLFLDPTQGISRLDKQLADYIAKQYKPCIFVVNKWDLMVADPRRPVAGRHGQVRQRASSTPSAHELHAPGVHHGQDRQERQGAAEPVAVDVQAGAASGSAPARSTGSSARPSRPTRPRCARTARPRIYYATQVGTAPPTIVLFVNSTVALRRRPTSATC